MIEYRTAGESHGRGFIVIISGIPAGLKLKASDVDFYLSRRQTGYGRGARTRKIEKDSVGIISGVRWGETIGSPVGFFIKNRDWENWGTIMSEHAEAKDENFMMTKPRPGHADLAGAIKYGREDLRDVLERASARETAARVAAGAVCLKLLDALSIKIHSFTKEIAGIRARAIKLDYDDVVRRTAVSSVRCLDEETGERMKKAIDEAASRGDTVGGVFTVVAWGVPPGFGSYESWSSRLDSRIARALMAIPSVKGVEFGRGFAASRLPGSKVHDQIFYDEGKGFYRKSNNAGGIEGGVSNGMPIIVRAAMKPIPSLKKPMNTIDIKTKKEVRGQIVRSDVCVVPSAGVIGEAVVAVELASAIVEKIGGDSMSDLLVNYGNYLDRIKDFWKRA